MANGDLNDGAMVQRALAQAFTIGDPLILAADGGARVARHFGLKLDAVLGDLDSLGADEAARLAAQDNTVIHRYPEEKAETDLEIALKWAAAQGVTWMRVLGAVGGRLDQTLSNVYLLALPELEGVDLALVAGAQETRLLRPGEHCIAGVPGDTISLIPLNGSVQGVRTEHLYYPLHDETLAFGPARGISNVLQAEVGRIWLRAGLLLLVHTVGRA